jgi:hypothetical protein
VALDRDPKRLAVAAADNTARIYTLKTGETPPTPKPDAKTDSKGAGDAKELKVAVGEQIRIQMKSKKRISKLACYNGDILELSNDPTDPTTAILIGRSVGNCRIALEDVDKRTEIHQVVVGREKPDARQTVEAFLDAAIAGKVEQALGNATISENKVKDFQKAGIKRVDISIVLADDSEALTISEPIELDKEGKGHMLLYLLKKDGRWKVRDIDFEPAEKAIRKQRDFLESHPEAKAVKARK